MSDPAILVHLPNWIGDAALAVPALRALQTARPDRRWVLVSSERAAPLFARWTSDLLIVAGKDGGEGVLSLARRLHALRCEAALVLPTSFRSALAPFLAGIPRRIAFASDSRRLLLTQPVKGIGRDEHLARHFVRLAASLGADPLAPLDPEVPIGEDELERQSRRLRTLGFAPEETIALCPGATYGETKRWPLNHWIALGGILRSRGMTILVLGGRDETGAGERISLDFRSGVHSLAGRIGLRESLALLRIVRGAVSNDSGAMHLAAAAGSPVLGLFGSTNPNWTGPLGRHSRSICLALPCSPCYSRNCPTQIECLRDMRPERVAAEFEKLLDDVNGERRS
jgi:heptosyltransferase II